MHSVTLGKVTLSCVAFAYRLPNRTLRQYATITFDKRHAIQFQREEEAQRAVCPGQRCSVTANGNCTSFASCESAAGRIRARRGAEKTQSSRPASRAGYCLLRTQTKMLSKVSQTKRNVLNSLIAYRDDDEFQGRATPFNLTILRSRREKVYLGSNWHKYN